MTEKTYPNVGDKLYLRQFTGSYYIDAVKRPYTVIEVSPSKVTIQKCELIAPIYHCCGNVYFDRPDLEGQRVFFYDTVAETIKPNLNGEIETLAWHDKKGMWGTKGRDSSYPLYAVFGEYKHYPYLD